jgi:hypothetical protein
MKKNLVIFLCVLLVNSLAFAAVNLNINTTVEGEDLIKLSLQPLQNGNSWNSAEEDLALTFITAAAQEAYVNLRTNNYTVYYINLLGIPLAATDVTTKIGYTVTPIAGDDYLIGDSLIVYASHVSDTVDHFVTFPRKHGMRVVPAKFSVELNETDWHGASAAAYSATVTFSLTTT